MISGEPNEVFIGILDYENPGVDSKIKILGNLEPKISAVQYFDGGHFGFF